MANFSVCRSVGASRYRFLILPTVLVVAALALPGCKKVVSDPSDPKFIVAEKGTWTVTRAELDKEVGNFMKQHGVTPDQVGPAKMPMVETVTLKNLILKKLLLDKAATEKPADLDKQEQAEFKAVQDRVPPGKNLDDLLKTAGLTVDDLKKQIEEKILVENVLKTEAFKNIEPTDQEIDKIYVANKDKFNIPPKVRASRILIHVDPSAIVTEKAAKEKLIKKAHDRVVKGEDFGKVAAEVSEDQSSKTKGGDLGFFAEGENPDEGFDKVAFSTKENTISPVFLTPLGYQFIKVTATQPAGIVPVADARGYISNQLRMQKMEQAAQDYTKKLLADSGVIYHLRLVDPPAQMAPGAGPGPGGPDDAGGPPPPEAAGAPESAPAPEPPAAPAPAPAPAPASAPATAPAPAK